MTLDYANAADRELAGVFDSREADWRNGAVVYQVIVDRFAPPLDLDAKRHLYAPPRRLRGWDEEPRHGRYLAAERLWSHELDFWGGDLASTASRLDHLAHLGADVLYLCPIHDAYTNHRYDALDYAKVGAELGTREDVCRLAAALHDRGMRLVLDGVFNHVGRNSELFRAAASGPDSPRRDWFVFGEEYAGGARAWADAENLPELNHENPAVREYVLGIVRSYLAEGVDGWRLDVAFDLGMTVLSEITAAAHHEKPGSLVVGEISGFPRDWFPSVDGLLQFSLRAILLQIASGGVAVRHGVRMLQRFYGDCDFEHLLKSWVYLDNHDTARLASLLPDAARRKLALVLMHTLPGSVNLYYGSELGMAGGDDPEMRAPMRWDLVTDDNPWLDLTRRLVALRRERRALRVGNLRWLETDRLIGFERYTDRARDMILVLANPSGEPVTETVLVPDSKLMSWIGLDDLLGGPQQTAKWATVTATLPPWGCAILTPRFETEGGYSPFKRVL